MTLLYIFWHLVMNRNDKDARNEYMRNYRKKNAERLREYYKEYELRNKSKRAAQKKETDKKYRLRNLDLIKLKNRTIKRRYATAKTDAKRRGIEFHLSFELWSSEVIKPCFYCGDKLGKRSETTVGCDRIDNSLGYIAGNIVSCCAFCNMTKGNRMSYIEMIEVAGTLIKIRNL